MKRIAFIYFDEGFKNQIQYTVETIFQNYEVQVSVMKNEDFKDLNKDFDLVISYGDIEGLANADVSLIQGALFSEEYLTLKSLPKKVEYLEGLPVFFKDKRQGYFLKNNLDKLLINVDIIQTTFFFLTCYEEYVINEYDKYGRFNIEKSILYKYNLLNRPVVNESIQWFIDILNSNYDLSIKKKNLWGEKKFQVLLSHDVDVIRKYLSFFREIRLQLSILLIDRKPLEVLKRIKGYIDTNLRRIEADPCNTFELIFNMEKKYGYNSSFYFMTDGKGYSFKNKAVKNIIAKIRHSKDEIGFHPGLGTAYDENLFNKEISIFKKELNKQEKIGLRQHYLSFNAQKTWSIHEKNDIYYDTTLCFPEQAGFKVGYCLPYKPYNLESNRIINIWEIPLIVMDGSLMQYMKLDYEGSVEYMKDLIGKVEMQGGIFVLLWHNSAISKEYNVYSKDIFQWFYDYIKNFNCDVTSGENIITKYQNII